MSKAKKQEAERKPVILKPGEVFIKSTFLRRANEAGYSVSESRQLFASYEAKGFFQKHKMIGVLQDTQSYIAQNKIS